MSTSSSNRAGRVCYAPLRRSARAVTSLMLCLLVSFLVPFLVGCGGSGSAVRSGARTGRATITIAWPATRAGNPSRVIPANTQSIRVRLTYQGIEVANQTVARPAGNGQSVVTLQDLPLVTLKGTAVAYAAPDGTGTALASAAFSLTIAPNSANPVTVSLSSAISALSIAPPATTSLISNQTLPLTALTLDAAGSEVPVPAANLTWASDNPTVASVNSVTGLVTALQIGSANITVTESDSKLTSKPLQIVVGAGVVASVAVATLATPPVLLNGNTPVALTPDQKQAFTTIIKDSNGNPITVTPARLTWQSDNTAVATVTANSDGTAVVTGIKPGTAHITVTETTSRQTGTATLIVGAGAIAQITLNPPSTPALIKGQSVTFTAQATDSKGNIVSVTPANLIWQSDSASLATVATNSDGTATVTGQSMGTATITVTETNSKKSQSIKITVRVDVEVTPGAAMISWQQTQQYAAVVTGAADTSVTWSVQPGGVGGKIDKQSGVYTAPTQSGVDTIVATSSADPAQNRAVQVTVVSGTGSVIVQ